MIRNQKKCHSFEEGDFHNSKLIYENELILYAACWIDSNWTSQKALSLISKSNIEKATKITEKIATKSIQKMHHKSMKT